MKMNLDKSFFEALYDLSFQTFVTPKIIRIVYVISLVLLAIWSFVFLVSGFMPSYGLFGSSGPSFLGILLHVIGAVVLFVLGSLSARISLEFVMAVFSIAENTESLRHRA